MLFFADGIQESKLVLYAVLFVGGVLFVVYSAIKRKYALCAFVTAFLIGVSLSLVYVLHLEATRLTVAYSEVSTHTIIVLEDARVEERGISYKAAIEDERGNTYRARVYETFSLMRYTGDALEVKTSLSQPTDSALAYYNTNGLLGNVSIKSVLQEHAALFEPISEFRRYVISCFKEIPGEAQLLLSALILGERSELSNSALYQEVKVTGLAHMIAVSGAHLVIIQGFLLIALKALKVSLRVNVAVQIAFLGVYMVFVGMPIPCLRATLMASVSLCALLAKRRSSAFSALGVAVVVFIVQDPSCAVSISFALSALATFGIMLFMPLFSNWYYARLSFLPRFIFEPLALTLCSLITTIPITTSSFSQFSLISPVANILVTPLFSFLCIAGVIVCLLVWLKPLFYGLFAFMCVVAQLLCDLIGLLASVPFACVPVSVDFISSLFFSVLVIALLWAWWPIPKKDFDWRESLKKDGFLSSNTNNTENSIGQNKVKKSHALIGVLLTMSVVLALFSTLALRQSEFPRVVMLDVGQGDAFLIQSEGKNLLVDTGTMSTKLYEGLGRFGVYHLDAIIVSHADDDHCGSLPDLKGIVAVDAVYVAKGMTQLQTEKVTELLNNARSLVSEEHIYELEAGDTLRLGASFIEVLGPQSCTNEGGNEDSLCFIFKVPSRSSDGFWDVLFCGDAESGQLKPLVDEKTLGDIDIYKVGHHGSKGALDRKLLATLKPEIALISVGENNRYGHPTKEILDLLDLFYVEALRSDQQGSVVCNLEPDRIAVQTMR